MSGPTGGSRLPAASERAVTAPQVRVVVTAGPAGTGTVTWDAPAGSTAETLTAAVRAVAEEALGNGGVRRLEATAAASDLSSRRALLRAGFRLEGTRRQSLERAGGGYDDELLLARLAEDVVGGPHGFSGVMNSALPRKRVIAHVLMRDAIGRVLLCETRFKTDWELPGGIVEPFESPRTGAAREVQEELGLDLPIGRLLLADWMPPYLGWEDAVELIFDGGTVAAEDVPGLVLQPSEIASVALCTLDEAAALVTPLSHRRLVLACALGPDQMAYTEDGRTS